MDKTNMAKRMKKYEGVSKGYLMKRCPVIIRIDGRSFHTFTKGFDRPFDVYLTEAMQLTMLELCKNIQGCVFGYTQSDEISLVLIDYQSLFTQPFFENNIQKVCSISASMATLYFNKFFKEIIDKEKKKYYNLIENVEIYKKKFENYDRKIEKGAMFDSRCFNITKEEVANYIFWRQDDAKRNSVQMLGRSYFSDKQLYKKGQSEIKRILKEEKNVSWEDLEEFYKYGSCSYKKDGNWIIDYSMPIIRNEDRDFVEKHIFI